mgnify:FL=1
MTVVRRRFNVYEFEQMGRAGILTEDDRVELIEGEIVEMTPIGLRHAGCVNRLVALLAPVVTSRALLHVRNPIRIGEQSEPQPDLALLRPRQDYYAAGHPGPEDILLVIEVAETWTAYDREVKISLYGRSGIREAWLVDLDAGQVEVFRQPGPEGYAERQILRAQDTVSPLALPDVSLRVGEILGS